MRWNGTQADVRVRRILGGVSEHELWQSHRPSSSLAPLGINDEGSCSRPCRLEAEPSVNSTASDTNTAAAGIMAS